MKATRSFLVWVVLGLLTASLLGDLLPGQQAPKADTSQIKSAMGKLPLYFVENRGVYPDEVKFYVQGVDKTLFFTSKGVTFSLRGKDRAWTVKLDFVGANEVQPERQDKQEAVFSYFKGPEKDWKTELPTFAKVVYEDLWPGIDLVYRGTVNKLKYEFVVAPGADPAKIRLLYRGASSVTATDAGALRVETPEGSLEDAPPVAWQDVEGERVPVEMHYRLDPGGAGDDSEFGYDLGDYDCTRPLILDPAILVYCGYIGGDRWDKSYGIAVDSSGNAYVTGATGSGPTTFPVKIGPCLTQASGGEAFVAKVNPAGTALVYCGYIGGANGDTASGIAVDQAGHAYVAGRTLSLQSSFPVKNGPDLTHNGASDAFVAKVNPAGTALVYCGYIGGGGGDECKGIAVDPAGNAYVTGYTDSTASTFPVKVGPDLTYGGGTSDAFVAKVNPSGTGLVYCGYIGGANGDTASGIAVDQAGHAYVAGATLSPPTSFPVRVGPGLTHKSANDAFVAKVNPQGTGFVYCGYIGGSIEDRALGIALDSAGNAVIAGYSVSPSGFPVTVGPDLTYNGGMIKGDAFVARVNASGRTLDYCGYIGGKDDEVATAVAVDAIGCAYVTGYTFSDQATFPVKVGPDLSFNRSPYPPAWRDAFVAKVDASGKYLVYCGYVGGRSGDTANSIAVDRSGNAYLAGTTSSKGTFPVVVGPDLTYNGKYGAEDAFVAKIAVTLLEGSGTPRPGGTVTLRLTSSDSPRLAYQVGSSFGAGPLPIGTRSIGLSPDALLFLSVAGAVPGVFSGYHGAIGDRGVATAAIRIPPVTALIGTDIHSAFVTLRASAPEGIQSISNTFAFRVAK